MDFLILSSEGLVGVAFGYLWGGGAHRRLRADPQVRRLAFAAAVLLLWWLQLATATLAMLAFRLWIDPGYLLSAAVVAGGILAWGFQLGYAAARPVAVPIRSPSARTATGDLNGLASPAPA